MGLSDNFSRDRASDDIEKQIADDSGRLKTALPSARCTVVEPLW